MKILPCFSALALMIGPGFAQTTTEHAVRERTDAEVLWQQDAATREQAAAHVKKYLRGPLTVAGAVQVALLNNRHLQATFEDIGIARADVIEAVTLPNPAVDFEVQFPVVAGELNRYGWLVAQEFARILMIPLKKKLSEEQLEAAELRVAAEVLDLVAEVKVAYYRVQADQQLLGRLRLIQQTNDSSGGSGPVWTRPPLAPGEPGRDYRPTVTLNGSTLPYRVVEGAKVFHLICEEVDHVFVPKTEANDELRATCWGFNGSVHGPTIECVEGDLIRIYVTNNLPAPTSIHWHGLLIPSGMDGVGGLSQTPIAPGETFKYEFAVWQHGTYMYHSHHDEMTQMALGMLGMFVVHPREPDAPPPDRDYTYMLSEWKIVAGTRRPDPNAMADFNILTFNGRAYPGTAPLLATLGDRVRIRIGNLSAMDHHPIHIHGHAWKLTDTDGGPIPKAGQWPETTVLVPTGSTRTVEFIADNPGDWAMHCHMTHHVMNQMGHGLPNLIGVDPGTLDKQVRAFLPGYMTMGQDGMGEMGDMGMRIPANSVPMVGSAGPHGYITMGGMYTNVKIRADWGDLDPAKGDDFLYGGWFENPPGTQAMVATTQDLQRDGIKNDQGPKTQAG